MIIKAQKYLIFGVQEDLDAFYERAQAKGFIEFISPRKSAKHLPEPIQALASALKFVRTMPVRSSSKEKAHSSDPLSLAKRVLELRDKIERLQEEKRIWEVEKARIEPFGDFSRGDISYIEERGHCKIQFFSAKSGRAGALVDNPHLIRLATESDLDYFISINPQVKNYPELTEMRIEHSLGEVVHKITLSSESIREAEKELKHLTTYQQDFEEELIRRLNEHGLNSAKEDAREPLEGAGVFSAEAWIPDSKVNGLMSLLDGLAVYVEKIGIEENDRVPTVMENEGTARTGEDLVRFYDVPSINDKDPSAWVFWSFALFFSIIIADGGYGIIFLILAAYLKRKKGTFYGSAKRVFKLFVTLSTCVVAWGVLTGSFFGLDLAPTNTLKEISPFTYLVEKKAEYHMQQKDDVYREYVHFSPAAAEAKTPRAFLDKAPEARKDFADDILLDITIIIGIVHIGCSLLRYVKRNLPAIGWVIFLIGSYLFFPTTLDATTLFNFLGWVDKATGARIGEVLVYGGFSLAVVLGLIQKKWKGLMEIMNVIQLGADVLSYLRLYALALASSIMAATFNGMGEMAGVAGGFFIILAGHVVNLSLGTMSGVIHGLRLNFIEWYRYSFEGGGRIFNPLRILRSKEE